MKTQRLYYDDPDLLDFDATVVDEIALGERYGIILDRTAFYPTSGGQPHDLGTIDGVPLVDCYEDEAEGTVVHVVGSKIEGREIHGTIDRERRADHRQQHSGQHVLSQAFVELFHWPTVSFHLGVLTCTIDLPVELISREQASHAENLANRIIEENRAVNIGYIHSDSVAEAGLRKPTERTGEIRLIDIAGFDRSACGGTHVRSTADIGSILITRIERANKQTRVEFICGKRVLQFARDANRVLQTISQAVSVSPFETAAAVTTIWGELQKSRKQIEDLEANLMDYEAAAFPVVDGLAVAAFKGRGIERIKLLASKLCALKPGTLALFADESDQLRVVFARSADMTVDTAALLKRTLEKFGGRGGGKPSLAQGGGLIADSAEAVLSYAKAAAMA